MKTAVVLFNLGGPDAPESVQPFLYNLFNDKAVINLPFPLRPLIAGWISKKRAPIAKNIYAHMGGKSPIREETHDQAEKLQQKLGEDYQVFFAMRYWHPFADEVAEQVKKYDPDRVVLLPLYPQFSASTTGSSLDDWHRAAQKTGLQKPTQAICCYPTHPQFIASHVAGILRTHRDASRFGNPRILFSAHGLPEKNIKAGDPYQWQIEQTVAAVVQKIEEILEMERGQEAESASRHWRATDGACNLQDSTASWDLQKQIPEAKLDYTICYQSRIGPLRWIGPATDAEIIRASADGVPILIVPIAFVSEHSETLVELDIEYKHLAEQHGCTQYHRVPALGIEEWFIDALADICTGADFLKPVCSSEHRRLCPKACGKCRMDQ